MKIKCLNFFSRPGSSAQKLKTRFNTWIMSKTSNGNHIAELFPPIELN